MNRNDIESAVTTAPVREGLAPTSEYIIVNTEIYADKDGNVVSRYDPSAVRCLAGPGGVIEKSFAERWGITGTLYVEGEPQPVVGTLNTPTQPGALRDSADEQEGEAEETSVSVVEAEPMVSATDVELPVADTEGEPTKTDVERPLGTQVVEENAEGEVEQIGQARAPRKYQK